MEQLKQLLTAAGIAYKENEPLAAHCTFKIGGPARLFVQPADRAQLCRAVALCKAQGVRYYLLGNGSNILFADEGYNGVVLDISSMQDTVEVHGTQLTAGAGVRLSALCKTALEHGLTGLEFAYGIPGTVGGAVYMNAGAYGGEMKDVLTTVQYLTAEGEVKEAAAAELDLRYRHSIFEENGGCILSAQFALTPGEPEAIRAKMDELMAKRLDKQPLDKPSAGSTFKRRWALLPLPSLTSAVCGATDTAVPLSARTLRLCGEPWRRHLRRRAGAVRRSTHHRKGKDRL